MNIYLAGNCGKDMRYFMKEIAKHIRKIDLGEEIECYCPFDLKIDEKDENGNWKMEKEVWGLAVFEADKKAIDNCDIFLMISEGRMSSAGTNWELGYAYALNKRTSVIQILNTDTSLMTFGGCTDFANVIVQPERHWLEKVLEETKKKIDLFVTAYKVKSEPVKDKCLTNLT